MSDKKSKDKYLKECQNFERLVSTVIRASSVRVVLICGRMTQAAMLDTAHGPKLTYTLKGILFQCEWSLKDHTYAGGLSASLGSKH